MLLKYSLYTSIDNNNNNNIPDFISKCYEIIKANIYPLYLQVSLSGIDTEQHTSKKSKKHNNNEDEDLSSLTVTRYITSFYGFITDIIKLNICNINV